MLKDKYVRYRGPFNVFFFFLTLIYCYFTLLFIPQNGLCDWRWRQALHYGQRVQYRRTSFPAQRYSQCGFPPRPHAPQHAQLQLPFWRQQDLPGVSSQEPNYAWREGEVAVVQQMSKTFVSSISIHGILFFTRVSIVMLENIFFQWWFIYDCPSLLLNKY